MTSVISFQQIIESIENLSLEEQEELFNLIQKRRIEKRRSEIATHAKETLKAVELGTAKRGSLEDLKSYLLGDEEE